jgi:hypothetical protein
MTRLIALAALVLSATACFDPFPFLEPTITCHKWVSKDTVTAGQDTVLTLISHPDSVCTVRH